MSNATRRPLPSATLDPADRDRLAALVARVGEKDAATALGIARVTLARLGSGLPVLRQTAECASTRLARLDAAEPTRAA